MCSWESETAFKIQINVSKAIAYLAELLLYRETFPVHGRMWTQIPEGLVLSSLEHKLVQLKFLAHCDLQVSLLQQVTGSMFIHSTNY